MHEMNSKRRCGRRLRSNDSKTKIEHLIRVCTCMGYAMHTISQENQTT